jgi:hypothetical protein
MTEATANRLICLKCPDDLRQRPPVDGACLCLADDEEDDIEVKTDVKGCPHGHFPPPKTPAEFVPRARRALPILSPARHAAAVKPVCESCDEFHAFNERPLQRDEVVLCWAVTPCCGGGEFGEVSVRHGKCPLNLWKPALERAELVDSITIGVTCFLRPRALERFIASVRATLGPDIRIIAADCGDRHAAVEDPNVEYHAMEMDAGVSAARNLIAEKARTEFVSINEEDFVYTAGTNVAAWLDVLRHDPQVGIIGSPLRVPNLDVVDDFCCDFDVWRDRLHIRAGRGPWRATPGGTAYRLCDMVFNFFLARTEAMRDHPLRPEIKIGEHFGWFLDVMKAKLWRVAWTAACIADHDREYDRNPEFERHRQRAGEFNRQVNQIHGYTGHTSDESIHIGTGRPSPTPNVVVLGVGHGGTTIITRMLHTLGLRAGDADEQYAESESVRELNERAWKSGKLGADAPRVLAQLPRPWCIKDPRFVQTLPLWLSAMVKYEPLLILLERDAAAVAASHERRGEKVRGGLTVEGAQALARRRFDAWPWAKLAVRYEDLARAVALFSPTPVAAATRCTGSP